MYDTCIVYFANVLTFFQSLENVYQQEEPIKESCDWMNVVADFLFQELRDTPEIKQLRKYCIHTTYCTVHGMVIVHACLGCINFFFTGFVLGPCILHVLGKESFCETFSFRDGPE